MLQSGHILTIPGQNHFKDSSHSALLVGHEEGHFFKPSLHTFFSYKRTTYKPSHTASLAM